MDQSLCARLPAPPVSVTAALEDAAGGFAAGRITVRFAPDHGASDAVLYWADENGILSGYTALPHCKVNGDEAALTLSECVLIPRGATRILAYGSNSMGLSPACADGALPPHGDAWEDGAPEIEFYVVSDIHITDDAQHAHNRNFARMLHDAARTSPHCAGVFVVGDTANKGEESQFQAALALHRSVPGAPPLYLAVGNHDLNGGTGEALTDEALAERTARFLRYATLPDGTHPASAHYDFRLGGYHFVFLGSDRQTGCRVWLSPRTLSWLDKTLSGDGEKPVFLFLHQSLYDTVAGGFPGQGWNGVTNDAELRAVLARHPNVFFFNGHSHWTLDSDGCMHAPDGDLPAIFNTASVAYLWTSYHKVTGENLSGSQGYCVRVYPGRVLVLGRDFTTGEWIPGALFSVRVNPETDAPERFDPMRAVKRRSAAAIGIAAVAAVGGALLHALLTSRRKH